MSNPLLRQIVLPCGATIERFRWRLMLLLRRYSGKIITEID